MSARLRNLNPYELHKYLVNVYCLNAKGSTAKIKRDTSNDRTDLDVIRDNHKFLWEEDDVADTWDKRLAKKYYDKLFKEYCICDLSRYKENKVALRWRVEQEVVMGKGQFQCGNKHCSRDDQLKSWEVNFAYVEESQRKNALVKIRLCSDCSTKLNYKSKKREVKRIKREQKKKRKPKNNSESSSENEDRITPIPEAELSVVEDANTAGSNTEPCGSTEQTTDSEMWKKGVQEIEEKTREEEFEEYLEDLLL